jgi:hypothetical protein
VHFFIDETGSFSGWGQFPSVSLLGALVIPDSRLVSLEREYKRLRRRLPQERGEVKGRRLNEDQVSSIVDLLMHHSAVFEAMGIDLGTHTQEIVTEFQRKTAAGITATLGDEHPQWMRDEAWRLRRQYETLSLPLVVQTELTFRMAKQLIEHGTMYFSQRRPEELAQFHWVIDAKGDRDTPTSWEQWWSTFIMPRLQNDALHEPFMQIPAGDYSHMRRFEGKLSEFWRELVKPAKDDAPAMNLGRILGESIRFSKNAEPGLELVDIVTNATRRALVGNLGRAGWEKIPSLMIHTSGPHYVIMLALKNEPKGTVRRPYAKTLLGFSKTGRNMLFKKWKERS